MDPFRRLLPDFSPADSRRPPRNRVPNHYRILPAGSPKYRFSPRFLETVREPLQTVTMMLESLWP
jgi:hypothetical protein